MKNIKLTFYQIAIVAVCGIATVSSCKKEKGYRNEQLKPNQYVDSRIFKFLSITLNAPLEQITYDNQKEEFIIYGKNNLSLKLVQEIYNNANEYKLKYEN